MAIQGPTTDVRPALQKSPIILVRGQSNYIYPDQRLRPENAEVMSNMNITEEGTAKKRRGAGKYNTAQISGGKAARGMIQRTFKGGAERFVEVAGTAVYTDDGSTRSAITGSVTVSDSPDARIRSVFIDDKEICTDGVSESFYIDAAGNAEVLTGEMWSTCQDFVVQSNVLFALNTTESGTKYPTRLRWCDIDPTTLNMSVAVWPTDSLYEVYKDGYPIIAGVDAFDRLIVVKEDGVYPHEVVTEEGFIEVKKNKPLRGGFSPVAKASVVTNPQFGVFIVTKDGAYVVREDFSFEPVSRHNQKDWNNLNQGRLQYAQSWIRETDHQVRTLLSSSTNTTGHDRIMVWDWETGDLWFDTPGWAVNYGTSWRLANVEYDILSTTDGYIQKANDSGKSDDDGTDIDWQVKMSPNDLGYPGVEKSIKNIRTFYRTQQGRQTVQHVASFNQGRSVERRTNFSLGTTMQWDSGLTWNAGLRYPGGTNEISTFFVNRMAETVAPEWTGTDSIDLQGYQVEFTVEE